MDNLPTWLKAEHWYHVFVMLGAAGMLASVSVELKGIANAHALLLFSGMFFVGIGEWINHPLQTALLPPNAYTGYGGQITGHPRNPKFIGSCFDLLGIGLLATGLYKLAQAV